MRRSAALRSGVDMEGVPARDAGSARKRELAEGEDRLLLERARLGLRLILAGVALVFVGALLIYPERTLIHVVQGINLLAVAAAALLLTDPARRTFNLAVGFAAYAITIVATGAVGILADDATTPVVILVALSVVSATLVPWTPSWQLASVVLVAATAVWTVATVVPSPRLFWLQNVGAIAPTLAASVVISGVFARQRAALARAQQEQRSREATLREANRRLEEEIHEHRRTEDALRFAMRELDHRVKNTLATVQSVADQTVRSSVSMSDFAASFTGRIQAMARIHTALAGRRWEGLSVGELIELVVGPYRRHTDSVSIESDEAFLGSEVVRTLGMALHELATNAAKYGALSTNGGRLAITSHVESGGASCLRIWWPEEGGPPVREPIRRGFGVKLIEEALAYEAEGQVQLHFPRQGVRCEIAIPIPPVPA
jgi:two-component sensor histidine kinase